MNENVDVEEEIESAMGTRDGWFTLGSMLTYHYFRALASGILVIKICEYYMRD